MSLGQERWTCRLLSLTLGQITPERPGKIATGMQERVMTGSPNKLKIRVYGYYRILHASGARRVAESRTFAGGTRASARANQLQDSQWNSRVLQFQLSRPKHGCQWPQQVDAPGRTLVDPSYEHKAAALYRTNGLIYTGDLEHNAGEMTHRPGRLAFPSGHCVIPSEVFAFGGCRARLITAADCTR